MQERFPQGFMMMVEGSQIDWGGHANDVDYMLSELREFDGVLGQVLEWAKKDGNTLVVVTGDHETGGLAINPGSTREKLVTSYATKNHSAVMVPVYAYGPGAELFTGIYNNTEIYNKMMRVLRLGGPR
jgi:alkaline phosphatase